MFSLPLRGGIKAAAKGGGRRVGSRNDALPDYFGVEDFGSVCF